MSEHGSGKRSTPVGAVGDGADSTPLPGLSRATPTELLRRLVGPQSPMAVQLGEVENPAQADATGAATETPSQVGARPTEPAFAPPEPPVRPPTTVRPAFVAGEDPPTPQPFTADREAPRGRFSPSDAPLASSLLERSRRALSPSGGLIAFVASVMVGVILVLLFRASDGTLMVTAGGPGNAPLAAARVELDGKPICENVPCRIAGVAEGDHTIRVSARGYRVPETRRVHLKGGAEVASHFTLEPEATGTIDVRVDAPGLRIYVDGQDRGPAPGIVTGLAATGHLVELLDNPLFAPFEQRVELGAGDVKLVEPTLTLVLGAIVLRPGKGAKDAIVFLERDGERRRVPSLPARIEVAPLGGYRIVATRPGFADFERAVSFSIGKPEVHVLIELERD
jgi:hypothetical protein